MTGQCLNGFETLSPYFHYYLSAIIAFCAGIVVIIAYTVLECRRKKTFYGVEDKMEEEELLREREKSIKNRPTEMKIVRSREAEDASSNGIRVLVKAKKRSHRGSLIRDYTPAFAPTPLIDSYMRRSTRHGSPDLKMLQGYSREATSRPQGSENAKTTVKSKPARPLSQNATSKGRAKFSKEHTTGRMGPAPASVDSPKTNLLKSDKKKETTKATQSQKLD
ncbi:unnamed protein product [Bursaphelenchus okinawaensis]|uniref:Uncharacterized protein n=1 Tax=Bursaphelenchus okinawaensis TaxID=465554 RepID=A0A811JQZ3_9BILA|nr:unnamed protein product [Bursaphelenchus okinawaensis]CAG9079005.1 unnamed protein product [Bursaphelenchus okinawaensis]